MSVKLPMFGARRARVLHVQPISIHGDVYYDVLAVLTGEPAPLAPPPGTGPADSADRIRIPSHLCPQPPEPGQTLELSFLMQQVSGVKVV